MPDKGMTSEDWVKVLTDCFASDMELIRLKAARDAKQCMSRKVARVLKQQLEAESSAEVRAALVESLAVVGGEGYYSTLAASLEDKDAQVRAMAIMALAMCSVDDETIPHFILHLQDSSNEVRMKALESLAIADNIVVGTTVERMLRSRLVEYRSSALHLMELAENTRTLILLKPLLDDDDPSIRARAEKLVGQMAEGGDLAAAAELKRKRG